MECLLGAGNTVIPEELIQRFKDLKRRYRKMYLDLNEIQIEAMIRLCIKYQYRPSGPERLARLKELLQEREERVKRWEEQEARQ